MRYLNGRSLVNSDSKDNETDLKFIQQKYYSSNTQNIQTIPKLTLSGFFLKNQISTNLSFSIMPCPLIISAKLSTKRYFQFPNPGCVGNWRPLPKIWADR